MLSKENLIGPNRARRAHNAIFVCFEDKAVPTEPLEAAKTNWQRNAMHHSDLRAEEEMRKVSFAGSCVVIYSQSKSRLKAHEKAQHFSVLRLRAFKQLWR